MDPYTLDKMRIDLRMLAHDATSPYTDGWTGSVYKKQIVELKWFIEDLIESMPYYEGEDQWDHERTLQLLKRKEKLNEPH